MRFRLPWVSRESYEIAIAAERARADAEHENAQALRRELADLTGKYHMLRLQGFAEPVQPKPLERKAPDVVKQAIAQAAGSNRSLRAQMEKQSKLDAAAGKSPDEIALSILEGVQVDHAINL